MSNPLLSIVIPSHQDNVECLATMRSIQQTASGLPANFTVEVILVDDASSPPLDIGPCVEGPFPHFSVIRNPRRIGCGPSRYVGACVARGKYLLFVDSHSRFTPGWFEAWSAAVQNTTPGVSEYTLWCGSCLALDKDHMDPVNHRGQYYGATWNFYGLDKSPTRKQFQTFECIWRKDDQPGANSYRIPAVMGACYFINREWFLKLDALRHLRTWGGDEQELTLKAWRSGGQIVLLKDVRIGHKFKNSTLNKILPWEPIYNKAFLILTCLPTHLSKRMIGRLPKGGATTMALRKIDEDRHLVAAAQAYNSTIFTASFESYLQEWGLDFPQD